VPKLQASFLSRQSAALSAEPKGRRTKYAREDHWQVNGKNWHNFPEDDVSELDPVCEEGGRSLEAECNARSGVVRRQRLGGTLNFYHREAA
jgi:hypothetical protein